MAIQGIQMNIETLHKLCRNFPTIANMPFNKISISEVNVILMIDLQKEIF
jgi:hypothetical protein